MEIRDVKRVFFSSFSDVHRETLEMKPQVAANGHASSLSMGSSDTIVVLSKLTKKQRDSIFIPGKQRLYSVPTSWFD